MSEYDKIIKSYPIVFKYAYGDPLVTCMAFGIECGKGWYEPINTMSAKLEELNRYYYPKYGVRIQYDQIKEKFGELTVYWSVESETIGFRRLISSPFRFVNNFINKHIHFKWKRIEDKPGYNTEEWCEITKEIYDAKEEPAHVGNYFGWKFKEENGKYYRNSCVFHCPQAHNELQNHKFLYWIKSVCNTIETYITDCEPTIQQECAYSYLTYEAERIVNAATKAAYEYCEDCGRHIGTRWSPRCQTTGWITYVCEDCARKRPGRQYIKNKALYLDGNMIQSPEERKAKLKERYGDAWTEEDDRRFDEGE